MGAIELRKIPYVQVNIKFKKKKDKIANAAVVVLVCKLQ
jgi:hypothetical protein